MYRVYDPKGWTATAHPFDTAEEAEEQATDLVARMPEYDRLYVRNMCTGALVCSVAMRDGEVRTERGG